MCRGTPQHEGMPPLHAKHTHISDSADHNTRTGSGTQDTGGRAHTQHTTQTQGETDRNQANSGHTQQRASSPEPSTPRRTALRPSSPEDQGMPEAEANVRYSQHQICVPLITDCVRAECSSSTSRPATTACSSEEQVQRTTASDRPTVEPQRSLNSPQHTDYSDCATEYSANATSTCSQMPSPDRTKYRIQHTIYSTKPPPPARFPDTTNDPEQQKQQVTALTTEAVQSQDTHTRDEQQQTDWCNTPDAPSHRQMTLSQTSIHSSIMDVDATNDRARQ